MGKIDLSAIKSFKQGIMTIGYLDMLGISKALLTSPLEDVVQSYISLFISQLASRTWYDGYEKDDSKKVKYYQFSDSTILIGDAKTGTEVATILAIVSGIMRDLLFTSKIPARGAVSVDEFCAIPSLNVYVGKPLIYAYNVECLTDWVGLTFVKPMEPPEDLMEFLNKHNWLSDFNVPLKAGAENKLEKIGVSKDRLVAVRWFNDMEKKEAEQLPDILMELAKEAKNDEERYKLQVGADFVKASLKEGSCDEE